MGEGHPYRAAGLGHTGADQGRLSHGARHGSLFENKSPALRLADSQVQRCDGVNSCMLAINNSTNPCDKYNLSAPSAPCVLYILCFMQSNSELNVYCQRNCIYLLQLRMYGSYMPCKCCATWRVTRAWGKVQTFEHGQCKQASLHLKNNVWFSSGWCNGAVAAVCVKSVAWDCCRLTQHTHPIKWPAGAACLRISKA